ncbi:uncharacterized protein [Temnothorax longispinosus]|uniref:uncharacterized protein n=1 Tax=Temnothorax longispinosus TaxID=300112 RepID=UPI003A99D31C
MRYYSSLCDQKIIMSNEEVDEIVADSEEYVADSEEYVDDSKEYVDYVEDHDEDLEWLDKRELIQLVRSNPALYAKSSKEYCGKGFDKDLAWQSLGSCLSKPMSGPEASKLFYNIRQRFGKERRQVAASLKGKSGQGAKAPYVPKWPLYEDCLFLADHIVGRKTSSSYNIQKTAAVTKFQAGGAASRFARPSSSPSAFRSLARRPSSSPSPPTSLARRPSSSPSPPTSLAQRPSPTPSPPTFRSLAQRPSPTPSPPVFRLPEASGSPWSSENDLFLNEEEEASVSSGASQSSPSEIVLQAIQEAGFKSKRIIPPPDNFAVKKKKDDDLLSQAIIDQTKQLSSVTDKLSHSYAVINPNSILGAVSIDKVIVQGVPVERHLECIMELLSIINEYVKGRQE